MKIIKEEVIKLEVEIEKIEPEESATAQAIINELLSNTQNKDGEIADTAVIPLSVQPETETPASLVDYFKGIEDNQVQSSEKLEFPWGELKKSNLFDKWKKSEQEESEYHKLNVSLKEGLEHAGSTGDARAGFMQNYNNKVSNVILIESLVKHLLEISKAALEYIIIQKYRDNCFLQLTEKIGRNTEYPRKRRVGELIKYARLTDGIMDMWSSFGWSDNIDILCRPGNNELYQLSDFNVVIIQIKYLLEIGLIEPIISYVNTAHVVESEIDKGDSRNFNTINKGEIPYNIKRIRSVFNFFYSENTDLTTSNKFKINFFKDIGNK